MEFLDPIKVYIDSLDKKKFRTISIAILGGIILIFGFLLFQYFRSIKNLQTKMNEINKKRKEVRQLLGRYELVKKQQVEVDAILEKEKDFKIEEFFEKMLNKVSISTNQVKSEGTTSEEVLKNYTEWTLDASLTKLNMQKLTELLVAIEQEERVYIKEIEIIRSQVPSSINVKLVIATLESGKETAETEE